MFREEFHFIYSLGLRAGAGRGRRRERWHGEALAADGTWGQDEGDVPGSC